MTGTLDGLSGRAPISQQRMRGVQREQWLLNLS